jgi:hypothetical protein
MKTCSNKHEEVCFNGENCPVCIERNKNDNVALEEKIFKMEKVIDSIYFILHDERSKYHE